MIRQRARQAIAASSLLILGVARQSFAQEAPAQQSSGTKQSAEARLKAAAKRTPSGPAHDVINTLAATRLFEHAAIAPGGKKVAWVEDILGKIGEPAGATPIFLKGLRSPAGPTL